MDLTHLPLALQPMQVAHIPAVMEIERQSFSLPWPESAYRHELTQNELAHYYVLCPRTMVTPMVPQAPWRRLWQRVIQPERTVDPRLVLGYGGFWLMYDEAHISTLAIRASWRRQGLGELLLLGLLDEARRIGASRATLEVRASNLAAQGLYAKYGFQQVGKRKAYYNDNQEDALILTTPEFASPQYQDLLDVRRRSLARHLAQISLDKILQMH